MKTMIISPDAYSAVLVKTAQIKAKIEAAKQSDDPEVRELASIAGYLLDVNSELATSAAEAQED